MGSKHLFCLLLIIFPKMTLAKEIFSNPKRGLKKKSTII